MLQPESKKGLVGTIIHLSGFHQDPGSYSEVF